MPKQKTNTKVKRKKKVVKNIEVDREISKLTKGLEIIRKIYTLNGSTYNVFNQIPNELIVDHTTEKGRKLLSSIYPDSHEIYLVEYHKPGEPSFPHGGIKIYNKTLGELKYVYPESVVKHKDVEYYTKSIEVD